MKAAAIIAEYNPFHNGHALHIERTRALCGATHIAAIMSGDFVQRGDVACVDKHTRALMALRGGADLVVELPLPWAMAGAETFARGGVGLASALGCVETLSFGSERGDIELIRKAVELSDSSSVNARFREQIDAGASYASARAAALSAMSPECAQIFSGANDTLGVEYCRAINRYASDIEPFCIKRVGAGHDSASIPSSSLPVSASLLRRLLSEVETWESAAELLGGHMPAAAVDLMGAALTESKAPADISRLDRALLMELRSMSIEQLSALPDVSEGLEHRIAECAARLSGSGAGFIRLSDEIKCKRYTHARIRRILLSALLGVVRDDSEGTPPYIRVLAMNRRGSEMLSACRLPVITRYAQVAQLDHRARRIFDLCTQASDIYGLTLPVVPSAGADLTTRLVLENTDSE